MMARFNTDIAVTANYIQLNFNNGEEIIDFTNYEVKGDVNYVPDSYPEMFVSESGKTYSVAKKQQEYFSFILNFQDELTRQKFERVRHYMQQGYKLVATVNNLHIPFNSFPPSYIGIDPEEEINPIAASFGDAVIELPPDFSADRTARNLGAVIVQDLPIRIYRGASLPAPVAACDLLDGSEWKYSDWQLDVNNFWEILAIYQEPSTAGPIDTVDSRPIAVLEIYDPSTDTWTGVDQFQWNGTFYEPINGPNFAYANFSYRFTIITQIVTLKTGETCSEVQFQQLFFEPERPGLGCADLSASDWLYQEWMLDNGTGELLAIPMDLSSSGIIEAINSHPIAILKNENGVAFETLTYDKNYFSPGVGAYVPDNGPNYPVAGWKIEVDGINVVTKGLSVCTTYFHQTYSPAGAEGLDYSLDFIMS